MEQNTSKENLTRAIQLIKEGKKKEGGQILLEIVKSEPQNEIAWLWLSSCLAEKNKKIQCLNKVLEINPGNEVAKNALVKLTEEVIVPEVDDVIGKKSSINTPQKNNNQKLILFAIPILLILILILIFLLFIYFQNNNGKKSLSSAENNINPIVEQTKTNIIEVASPTIAPSLTSTILPTSSSTPEPKLFTKSAVNYLPSQNDMPKDYEILTKSSGSFRVEDLAGYKLIYTTEAYSTSGRGPQSVTFLGVVFENEDIAKKYYDLFKRSEFLKLNVNESMVTSNFDFIELDVPMYFGVKEYQVFGSEMEMDRFQYQILSLVFREKNFVCLIETRTLNSDLSTQAVDQISSILHYYGGLVYEKLYNE